MGFCGVWIETHDPARIIDERSVVVAISKPANSSVTKKSRISGRAKFLCAALILLLALF